MKDKPYNKDPVIYVNHKDEATMINRFVDYEYDEILSKPKILTHHMVPSGIFFLVVECQVYRGEILNREGW